MGSSSPLLGKLEPVETAAMSSVPISILDLAAVGEQESIAESLEGSVLLAQSAEQAGYRRVWYAEHHNIPRSPPRPQLC